MTKKNLHGIVAAVVAQVAKAHGGIDEDSARCLVGMAVKRNADLLVGATSPPGQVPVELVGKDTPEGEIELES